MKKIFAAVILLMSVFSFTARADEGMWILPLIEKLNIGQMTEMGLRLSAEDIYSLNKACLLYTSDAADDLPCVDLGRRRIITKNKRRETLP